MVEVTKTEYQILRSAAPNTIQLDSECSHTEIESILEGVKDYTPSTKRQEMRWYYGSLRDKLRKMADDGVGPHTFEVTEL